MKRLLLIVFTLCIALSVWSVSWGLGVKLHGHVEPFVTARFDLGTVDLMLKTGIIPGESIVDVIVPGFFITTDLCNFRFHGGFEGLWHLKEGECLVLGRLGVNYGLNLKIATLYLGGEIGFPINLPGDFFVETNNLYPIPTLITYLEF